MLVAHEEGPQSLHAVRYNVSVDLLLGELRVLSSEELRELTQREGRVELEIAPDPGDEYLRNVIGEEHLALMLHAHLALVHRHVVVRRCYGQELRGALEEVLSQLIRPECQNRVTDPTHARQRLCYLVVEVL